MLLASITLRQRSSPELRDQPERRLQICVPRRRSKSGTRSNSVWAYSSIGQSPRLITGLFLVQVQVGLRNVHVTVVQWQETMAQK